MRVPFGGRFSKAAFAWVCVIMLAAIGVVVGLLVASRVPVGVAVGERAPDFSLEHLISNRPVSLKEFRGNVVILLFWQSTCPDCRLAMPYFQELLDAYGSQGLVVLGVDLDRDPDQARSYLEEHGYTLIPLWGSYEEAMSIVELFQVPLVPHAILIDKKGIIRFRGTFPDLPSTAEIEKWLSR